MKVFIVLVVYVTVGLQLTVIAMERWRKIVHPTWTQFNISVGRIISTPIVVGAMVLNMPSYMLFIPRDMIYIKYSGDGDFNTATVFLTLTVIFLAVHLASFVHFLMLVRDLVTVEGRPFTSVANKVAYDVLDHTILVYYMAPFPVFLCFSGRQVVRMVGLKIPLRPEDEPQEEPPAPQVQDTPEEVTPVLPTVPDADAKPAKSALKRHVSPATDGQDEGAKTDAEAATPSGGDEASEGSSKRRKPRFAVFADAGSIDADDKKPIKPSRRGTQFVPADKVTEVQDLVTETVDHASEVKPTPTGEGTTSGSPAKWATAPAKPDGPGAGEPKEGHSESLEK
ncbi:hypothetical protein BaRGS_00003097 [Batillaria attramentaria]|uniref:Uncharacterized protein n=1 Tax=Batillaria attramentaria TaxID=370345 RepID=A0ABD0M267_9CAEN